MSNPHKVKIEWSYDDSDCETCGGSYAEGAVAWVDDVVVFDKPAVASCFGETNVSEGEVYNAILNYIGYDVESWVEE